MVTYPRSHTAVMADSMLEFFTSRVRAAQLQVFCAEYWGRVGWERDHSMLDLTPGFLFGALNIGLAAAGPAPTALSATPIPSNL